MAVSGNTTEMTTASFLVHVAVLWILTPMAHAQVTQGPVRKALNDRDVNSPVTNPAFDAYQAQCRLGVKIVGALPVFRPDLPVKAKVTFHPGSEKAIVQINQKRYDDSRTPAVGGTFLDKAIQAKLQHVLRIDRKGILHGVWTPRHSAPPFFKIYELDLGIKTDEVHVLPTEDPFLVAVWRFRTGYAEPHRFVFGPYCYTNDKSISK